MRQRLLLYGSRKNGLVVTVSARALKVARRNSLSGLLHQNGTRPIASPPAGACPHDRQPRQLASTEVDAFALGATSTYREQRSVRMDVKGKTTMGYVSAIAATVLVMAMAEPTAAQQVNVKVGILTCDVSAGIGFIIGSHKT